jgi:hypothetical protein
MGLLGNLFGTKNAENQPVGAMTPAQPASPEPLSPAQREALSHATLPLLATQLYLHYWLPTLPEEDAQDQTWRNQVLYFWKAEEPFPNKSLPPVFETFQVKTFLFTGDTTELTVEVGQVAPWFGMPGQGEKHLCLRHGQEITIPALYRLGVVEYVERVELTPHNLATLTDRQHYFFLLDNQLTPFENGTFYYRGQPVTLADAYSVGGLQLVRRATLS